MPEGVTPHPNGTLAFRRPLSASDAGAYRCTAKNDVGAASALVKISVAGRRQRCRRLEGRKETNPPHNPPFCLFGFFFFPPPPTEKRDMTESTLMIVVGAAAGGLLILMLVVIILVTCHHKRKNKVLEKELNQKK